MIIKRIFNNKKKKSQEKMETLSGSSEMAKKKRRMKNQNLRMKKAVEDIGKVAGMRFVKMPKSVSVIVCTRFSN